MSYPKIPSTLNRWLPSTHNRCQVHTQQMATNIWQMVKTHTFCAQFDWLKISLQEMSCRKYKYDKRWRKNKAGISINSHLEKNCLIFSSTSSRICIRQHWSEAEFQLNAEQWNLKKVYKREHLLALHIQWFYWPGSYALRGVIEFGCMLKMGAPLFLKALFIDEPSWRKLTVVY